MKRTHGLDEREMELVKLLMADCQTTGDIQAKLKKLLKPNIRLYIITYSSTKLNYQPETKLRQVYGMNGMLFKDGELTIGRNFLSQKSFFRRLFKKVSLQWTNMANLFAMIQEESSQVRIFTIFLAL